MVNFEFLTFLKHVFILHPHPLAEGRRRRADRPDIASLWLAGWGCNFIILHETFFTKEFI